MLAYPDVQVLDVTGPLEVFGRAARWIRDHGLSRELAYHVEIWRPKPVRFAARRACGWWPNAPTAAYAAPIRCSSPAGWVTPRQRRDGKLAEVAVRDVGEGRASRLDLQRCSDSRGKRTAAGTSCHDALGLPARAADDIGGGVCDEGYLHPDGNFYTSAGVTAGMDMALAMLEEDWGTPVAGPRWRASSCWF